MSNVAAPGLSPENWVANYADNLFKYAVSRVSNEELARDIVQDTFVSALKAASKFQGRSTEKTWLFSILRNKIIDTYRAKAKYREVSIDTSENSEAEDVFFNTSGSWKRDKYPQDWTVNLDSDIEEKEFFQTLRGCLAKLSEKQRLVFSMKYLEGMDSEDICKEMGITPSNYWVLIHRAKLALRDCLETHWIKK
ncbi:MAG: sigma-70 family RNA polymerase sigma factor [Saprospiraceae bacterium]|nr:sigma-70 family RNA polymerase sigma factor [Saprospiraceae bacterium]